MLLLERAERQARDTTRKHHIEDIEHSLYFARSLHGSFPPYDRLSWCGFLDAPEHASLRSQVEEALRSSHEKYANPEKPFPTDPLAPAHGYFYWKRSPGLFELYSILEAAPTGERQTTECETAPAARFDYAIASHLREDRSEAVIIDTPI